MASLTRTGLAPDRSTRLARNGDLLVFAVNGFSLASWTSRIPDVKEHLHLTPGSLGVMLLALSAGAVLGLPLAGRVAHRFGATRAVRLGMLLAMPGVALGALAAQLRAPLGLIMAALFFVGLGNGIWDVAQNLEGTVIERALERAIMPWFHAAFSGGTVLAALIGAGMTWLRVPLVVHVGAAAALTAVAVMWGTAQFLHSAGGDDETLAHPGGDDRTQSHPVEEPTGHRAPAAGPARSAWTEPRTLLIGVMVLAAAFAEGTANDWMAVAFVDGHHLEKALGVVALAVFLSFMTAGRVLGTGLLDRHGRVLVLRGLFGAAIVGCLLVVFGNPLLAFVGAAVWGLGASLGFPVGMSAAADDPSRAPLRISVVSTVGYLAFLGGPPLLGFLGDHFGVLHALLVVGAVSILAMLVVPVARPLQGSAAQR